MTLAVALGCGGGGSSAPTANTTANLFLTDAINSNYDHVWATVTKVDLVSSTGQTKSIYNMPSSGGQVVDLLSLHPASGQKYLLLAAFSAPSGSFTGANVTVSSSVSIMPKGSSTAVSAKFAGSTGGSTVLAAKFSSAVNFANSKNVIVDFDLANWNLNGSTISAANNQFVQGGPGNGPMLPGNCLGGNYFGTVSNLSGTAPAFTFSITQGPNVVNILTSSSTVLYNSDGSTNPTLANGEFVNVAGAFDATNNVVDATAIIIQVGALPPPPAFIFGQVSADSLANNTITVTTAGCAGFQPTATSLTIDVSSSTAFVDASGVTDTEAQFFANLTPGTTSVQVQGTISGSTVTAASVMIVSSTGVTGGGGGNGGGGGAGNPIIVAVAGPVSNVNATSETFSITLANWTGGWQSPNSVLSVTTTSSTQYTSNGTTESAAAFFTSLTNSTMVQVRGTLDPTTSAVVATNVDLGSPNGLVKKK